MNKLGTIVGTSVCLLCLLAVAFVLLWHFNVVQINKVAGANSDKITITYPVEKGASGKWSLIEVDNENHYANLMYTLPQTLGADKDSKVEIQFTLNGKTYGGKMTYSTDSDIPAFALNCEQTIANKGTISYDVSFVDGYASDEQTGDFTKSDNMLLIMYVSLSNVSDYEFSFAEFELTSLVIDGEEMVEQKDNAKSDNGTIENSGTINGNTTIPGTISGGGTIPSNIE